VATEAAWLQGTIWKKKKCRRKKKRKKNEKNGLTLTGLLMEGLEDYFRFARVIHPRSAGGSR
jgi:hypothetical protein